MSKTDDKTTGAPRSLDGLVGNLRELQAQWRETARVLRPIDIDGSVAYLECAEELEEILNGNLRSIAKWSDDIPNATNEPPRLGKD